MNLSTIKISLKTALKKKRTWAAILLVGGVGAYAAFGGGEKPPTFVTDTVRVGSLVQTVEATGTLSSTREVHLGFETAGTVGGVYVGVGSKVQPGQLLASLKGDELYASADQARRGVQVAQASIAAANAAVASAETDLANARRALDRSLDKDGQSLVQAQQSVVTALPAAMITDRKAISDADEVLGIDNTLANDDFELVLGALDGTALTDARNAYRVAKDSRTRAELAVFALSGSYEEARALVPAVQQALTDTATLLLHVNRVLDATAVDTNDFSFADLSALKAKINAARDAVQAAQVSLLANLQAVDAAPVAGAVAEQTARANVDSAEAALRAARAAVDVRQAELLQAQAALAAANARAGNAQIRSSIAGTVTSVDVKAGEQAGLGASVITVQTVDDEFEIKTNVPEADIAKVSLRDAVDVTFDAFGDNVHFAGSVARIDPAQKTVEGVVFYEVTVLLDDAARGRGLKPGMTADITVTTELIDGALIVPQRAVLLKNGRNVVRVKTGETTYEEREVRTGIRGDEGRTQVLEGLDEGDVVVLSIQQP